MRIDAGLIIGVALEFIIMLYFANSTLQPKKNYYISSAMCFVGYLIVFAFSLFNQLFVNVGVFIVINLLIFNLGYRINFKTSIFQTMMLLVFMFLGEIIVTFIFGRNYSNVYYENGIRQEKLFRSHASTVNDYNGGGKIDILFIGIFNENSRQKKGYFLRKIFSVVSGSSYNDFCVFNYGLSAEY